MWSLGTYKKGPEGGQLPPTEQAEQKYAPPAALPWSWDWGPQLANDLCCQDKLTARLLTCRQMLKLGIYGRSYIVWAVGLAVVARTQ